MNVQKILRLRRNVLRDVVVVAGLRMTYGYED